MDSTRGASRALFALTLALSLTAVSTDGAKADKPSTPVEITNSNTNPAITSDIDNPGRAPYQSFDEERCSGTVCVFNFTAPADHRIVVQNLSAFLGIIGSLTQVQVLLSLSGFAPSAFITEFAVPGAVQAGIQAFDRHVLFYMGAGQEVTMFVVLAGGASYAGESFGKQVITLTGYAVDCTVAKCAPIVH
jgi:hypothetical protein